MNKTQVNHIVSRMEGAKRKKLQEVQKPLDEHKLAQNKPNAFTIGKKWANKNPKAFVKLFFEEAHPDKYDGGKLKNVLKNTPAYKRAHESWCEEKARLEAEIADKHKKMDDEIMRVEDDLVLGDTDDGRRALATFRTFVENL